MPSFTPLNINCADDRAYTVSSYDGCKPDLIIKIKSGIQPQSGSDIGDLTFAVRTLQQMHGLCLGCVARHPRRVIPNDALYFMQLINDINGVCGREVFEFLNNVVDCEIIDVAIREFDRIKLRFKGIFEERGYNLTDALITQILADATPFTVTEIRYELSPL